MPTDPYLGARTLMRTFLDSVLPPGVAWQPRVGGDLDNFLSGLGDGLQAVMDFETSMGTLRDPYSTAYLDEIEREYGVSPNTQLTDAQRRATLALAKFKRSVPSTITSLQNALDRAGLGAAGYGLVVYANDPPVDPDPFTQYAFITMCNAIPTTACCGYYPTAGAPISAVCGVSGAYWVINGDVVVQTPAYLDCGDYRMCCGYFPSAGASISAVCGMYYTLTYTIITVASPVDSWTWPMVFFIAAGASRADSWLLNDSFPLPMAQAFAGQAGYGIGAITALQAGNIPQNMRQTLIEIICRWKPIHTWCALSCNFN